MRRIVNLFSLSLLTLLPAASHAQVWEKFIAPGLTYRMELDPALPRTIHALKFDLSSTAIHADAELGQLKVYNDDPTKGRATVSELVKRTGAIAGINASFFPYTGRPVGVMVRKGELISSTRPFRPDFGWGSDKQTALGFLNYKGSLRASSLQVDIDTINEEAKPDTLSLDTDTCGYALTKTVKGTCAMLRVLDDRLTPDSTWDAEVISVTPDQDKMPIPAGQAALVGTGIRAAEVASLKPGDRVEINVKVSGFDWSKIDNCVCGGPMLLRDGKKVVDWKEEGFNDEFSNKRHPRTAVGRDAAGNLWLVVVDGKLSESVGATLEEMADVMAKLGCVDAMNLDGGASSTMNLLGEDVNRPADGVERKVANAILFFGTPDPQQVSASLDLPAQLKLGQTVQLHLNRATGGELPNSEVIWSATGSGWIDQGGALRADKAGPITVQAYYRGKWFSASAVVMAS